MIGWMEGALEALRMGGWVDTRVEQMHGIMVLSESVIKPDSCDEDAVSRRN